MPHGLELVSAGAGAFSARATHDSTPRQAPATKKAHLNRFCLRRCDGQDELDREEWNENISETWLRLSNFFAARKERVNCSVEKLGVHASTLPLRII
jgi:hypothetical protein